MAWEEIERLRGDLAQELAQHDASSALSPEVRRERARALIRQIVSAWSQQRSRTHTPLTRYEEAAVERAVFDAHFRAGPLQRYLDMPGVEEIYVDGMEAVIVDSREEGRQRFPPLVSTEEELRQLIDRLARESGHGERRLTEASPVVHFRLHDRSRVAATLAPLSSRTTMVIRKHGLLRAGLPELEEWGAISPAMRAFLMAAVLAGKSMVVAGPMRAGKTTLLRGLARVVPSDETLVTMETDRELFLDEDQFDPEIVTSGAHVMAWEERHSNGEDGAGELTVREMIPHALRMGASRIIVGEVRDAVAAEMLKATSAGGVGSMTTLHATTPHVVFPRLEQLCQEAGLSPDAARSLIAVSLNLIVFIHQKLRPRRQRWVSHIWEVTPGENGPAVSPVFEPDPAVGEMRGVPKHVPQCMPELEHAGLVREWLTNPEYGKWPQPFQPARRRAAT